MSDSSGEVYNCTMAEMQQRHVRLRSLIVEQYLERANACGQDTVTITEWLRNMDNWCESHAISENSVARFMIKNYYADDQYPMLMRWIVVGDSTASEFSSWLFFWEKLYFHLRDQFPANEVMNYALASYGLEIALSRFTITDELDALLHTLLCDSEYRLEETAEYVTRMVAELALQKSVWKARIQPGEPRMKRSLPDPMPVIPEGTKRLRTRKQTKDFEYY
jgi:hypothetical protein